MSTAMKTDVVHEVVKAAPPVAVATAATVGMTLNELVAIATLIYVVLQAGYLLWKWYREWKKSD